MRNSDLEQKELKKAENTAYRILAIRSRSRFEIETKLHENGFSSAVVETVIKHLLRLGYVDDQKFSCQWAASRTKLRGCGRRKIEQELKQKGISREIIHEALEETIPREDERETARRVAEKKLKTMKNLLPEARKKRLAGFLERKGFSSDIIYAILRTL